ncbi:hypothetical protein CM15mP35_03450 [bacterium]|nr:MAG: hypothetical protein CM15mP35_03450 [bacterium]
MKSFNLSNSIQNKLSYLIFSSISLALKPSANTLLKLIKYLKKY